MISLPERTYSLRKPCIIEVLICRLHFISGEKNHILEKNQEKESLVALIFRDVLETLSIFKEDKLPH